MAGDLPTVGNGSNSTKQSGRESSQELVGEGRRYRLLLEVAKVVSQCGEPLDVFKEIAPLIFDLTGCHFLTFSSNEERQERILTYYWTRNQEAGDYALFPVDDCVAGWVWKNQQAIALADIQLENRFHPCLAVLRKHAVRSYSVWPLSRTNKHHRAIGLGSDRPQVANGEAEFLACVARLVSLALENRDSAGSLEENEKRLQSLMKIGQVLTRDLSPETLLPAVLADARRIMGCDYTALALLEDDGEHVLRFAADWDDEMQSVSQESCQRIPLSNATAARAIESRAISYWNDEDMERANSPTMRTLLDAGIQSVCNVPLIAGDSVLGALNLGSRRKQAFGSQDAGYIQQIANQVAIALYNGRGRGERGKCKDRPAVETRYLQGELRSDDRAREIVGESGLLKRALDQASIVAPTDSTVLITGETGTGKECVARVIHATSKRRDQGFIKLNCAAIPTGLLESELFGHEKGAFTGAISQKVGRLELADEGTLFLDEVGDIPLELQPKLLRVLQDQEFERLGSTRTIHVNVRILAATNRDLVRAVQDQEFRNDLFYRLHVFPIHLPALRDRREDIPLLVRHFVEKFSAKLRRNIEIIPDEAITAMMKWNWSGNVRELENFIERSVILSEGIVLRAPLMELRQEPGRAAQNGATTLREKEREHIVEALRHTRGVLSGPSGAAARLGLKRTTLQYKMQKLGISRVEYLN